MTIENSTSVSVDRKAVSAVTDALNETDRAASGLRVVLDSLEEYVHLLSHQKYPSAAGLFEAALSCVQRLEKVVEDSRPHCEIVDGELR